MKDSTKEWGEALGVAFICLAAGAIVIGTIIVSVLTWGVN